MKHINLTEIQANGLARFMITQESNNYGDQVLSLKELKSDTHYEIIAITSRQEGEWMQLHNMREWAREVFNESHHQA